MDQEKINKIEYAFKHGDCFVFQIEGRGVFVAERVLKHKKEATVEMCESYEVDDTCFQEDGEYYGDTKGAPVTFILDDPYADNASTIASVYYLDEIKEEIK